MGKKNKLQIVCGTRREDDAPGMEMDRRTFLKGSGGAAGVRGVSALLAGLGVAIAAPKDVLAWPGGNNNPTQHYTFTNDNIGQDAWFLTSYDELTADECFGNMGTGGQKEWSWLKVDRIAKHTYRFHPYIRLWCGSYHGWGSDKHFYISSESDPERSLGVIYVPIDKGYTLDVDAVFEIALRKGTYRFRMEEVFPSESGNEAGLSIPVGVLIQCAIYIPPFESALEKRWWGDNFEHGKLEGRRALPTGQYRFYIVHAGTKWYLDIDSRLSPDGTNVLLYHDNKPNVTQIWTVTHKRWGDRAGGYAQLASGGNMVMKLSDKGGWGESGGDVVLWHDDDAGDKNWCRWIPEASGKTDNGHKGYVLRPSTNPAMALMPDNSPWVDGHNVIMGKTVGNDPDLYTWYAEPVDGSYKDMQAEVDQWVSDGVALPRISPYGPSGSYDVYSDSACSTLVNPVDQHIPTGQGDSAITVWIDYDYWIREAGSCSQLRRDGLTRCFYDQDAPAPGARIEFAGWPQKARIRLKVRPATKVAYGVPNGCYKVAESGGTLTFVDDPGYCRINEGDDSYCTLRAKAAPADRFIVINRSDGTVRISPWRNAACALRPSAASSNVRSTPYNDDAAFLWEARRLDGGEVALQPHGASTGIAADGTLASGSGAAWALNVSESDPLSSFKPADGWHFVFQTWYYYLSGVKQRGWLVHGGLRYWLDAETGARAEDRLVTPDEGAGYYAYARPGGYIVRGKYRAADGVTYLANNDGKLENPGDLVTGTYDGGAANRYYIDPERHGCVPGYDPKRKVCVMSDGHVVRGKYQDPSTGVWYFADNDGKLEVGDPGWLVTNAYGDGQQRYYIEPDVGGAVPGFSEHGWFHYTTGKGYVLINDTISYCGATWRANNDGLLTKV